MADCELCGVALPTLVPVCIYKPKYAQSYPNGMWQGLCEQCANAAAHTLEGQKQSFSCGEAGKCDMCSSIERLYDVSINRPSFSMGSVKDTAHLCTRCLNSIGNAKTAFAREKAAEHAHDHKHH